MTFENKTAYNFLQSVVESDSVENMENYMLPEITENIHFMLPEIKETTKAITLNVLPEKSKKSYEIAYNAFIEWRATNNINSFSEDILLRYFSELSQKYKSTSLWTIYSMLKSTLNIHHNVNIELYTQLHSFLKQQSDGYKAKTTAVFTPTQIHEFINEAPDDKYLVAKVALIMGVMGSCRSNELDSMKIEHLQDYNSALLVDIPATNTKIARRFLINESYYDIVKKYMSLRPLDCRTNSFLLNFQKGKCTEEKMGINKIRSFGKRIATYLELPNPENYTGLCLRRSSASLFTDGRANTVTLKNHEGWKSTFVPEGYVDRTITNKETPIKIVEPCSSNGLRASNIHSVASPPNASSAPIVSTASIASSTPTGSSSYLNFNNTSNVCNGVSDSSIHVNMRSTPRINFTNCKNVSVYFNTKETIE